jgi:hypothetical protein
LAQYFLRIIAQDIVTKNMEADDDEAALRAAIRWENHNPDMDLTCGLRRVALRRQSVWYLQPDLNVESDEDRSRHAVDEFTLSAGWTSEAAGRGQPGISDPAPAQTAQARDTTAIMKLLERLRGID